jgi:hypothetical protein
MNRDEFITAYQSFAEYALYLIYKANQEGLLSLEKYIDREKVDERDIFHYGLSYVIDNGPPYGEDDIIFKVLSNIIAQEKDEYMRKFKNIQKEAVLMLGNIWPLKTFTVFNSYTDLPLKEDKVKKIADELTEKIYEERKKYKEQYRRNHK